MLRWGISKGASRIVFTITDASVHLPKKSFKEMTKFILTKVCFKSTLFILMYYPIHIGTIRMELSISNSKGLQNEISIKYCFHLSKKKQIDPDEMPLKIEHYIWVIIVCQRTCLHVPQSRMKRV